jgi:hypothetical protein
MLRDRPKNVQATKLWATIASFNVMAPFVPSTAPLTNTRVRLCRHQVRTHGQGGRTCLQTGDCSCSVLALTLLLLHLISATVAMAFTTPHDTSSHIDTDISYTSNQQSYNDNYLLFVLTSNFTFTAYCICKTRLFHVSLNTYSINEKCI